MNPTASVSGKSKAPPSAAYGPSGWDLFKARDFTLLWASQAVSQIGDGLIKIALLWFVYKLTGSALKMTVIGLLQTIPPLLLSPVIGVYLDRLPKKPIMMGADMIRASLLVLIPILHAWGALSLAGLYLLVFLIAVVFTAFGPALSSSVPLIVNRSQLTAANALIQGTATMGMILGPVISGSGIALIGPENMLYVGAPAFLIAAVLLIPIQLGEPWKIGRLTVTRSVLEDMLTGLTYVWTRHAGIRVVLIVTALHSVVASAFVFLLPVFADRSLQVGPMELGWLWSAYGGGMLIAAAWLTCTRQTGVGIRVWTVCVALGCGGLAAGALALLPPLSVALFLNVIIGVSLGSFTPVTWSLLQEWVPEDLRGRVFALVNTVAMSSSLVGMLLFGSSAEVLGPDPSLVGMALALLGTSLLFMRIKDPVSERIEASAAVPTNR